MFSALWADIRYAVRVMLRTPLFTVTVVLTVAIAIAANATIFTVVNAVMLRSLPYAQPDRIMQVAEKNDKLNLPTFGVSVLNFLSWREQTQAFEQLAAVGYATFTVSGSGEPEQLSGNRISPALTHVLGTRMLAGREFRDDEEQPGGAAVAMIGEGLWRRRFASGPGLVGNTISLDGVPTLVVGIAPASLKLIGGGDIYTPLAIDPSKEIRLNHVISVFGKLRPGVTPQQAQAEMDTISVRVGQQYPEVRYWGIHLLTLFDTFVGTDLKTGLLVLLVAVVFVLLIACANVANLLLARAATRQKEMAVRTALGATRSRLIRQLLVESVALSILGGGAGLLGAIAAVRVLTRSLPEGTLPFPDIGVDATVLWFSFALTIATGVLFGFAPAWRIATAKASDRLKEGGRGSTGGIRGRNCAGRYLIDWRGPADAEPGQPAARAPGIRLQPSDDVSTRSAGATISAGRQGAGVVSPAYREPAIASWRDQRGGFERNSLRRGKLRAASHDHERSVRVAARDRGAHRLAQREQWLLRYDAYPDVARPHL
jgi:putative ABC transport system permease protein